MKEKSRIELVEALRVLFPDKDVVVVIKEIACLQEV
jgi:hypothetical protein